MAPPEPESVPAAADLLGALEADDGTEWNDDHTKILSCDSRARVLWEHRLEGAVLGAVRNFGRLERENGDTAGLLAKIDRVPHLRQFKYERNNGQRAYALTATPVPCGELGDPKARMLAIEECERLGGRCVFGRFAAREGRRDKQ